MSAIHLAFSLDKKEYGDVIVFVFNLLEWYNTNKAYKEFERTLLEAVEKVKK